MINSSCLNNTVGRIQSVKNNSSVTVLKTVVAKISPRRDGGIEVAGDQKREKFYYYKQDTFLL